MKRRRAPRPTDGDWNNSTCSVAAEEGIDVFQEFAGSPRRHLGDRGLEFRRAAEIDGTAVQRVRSDEVDIRPRDSEVKIR